MTARVEAERAIADVLAGHRENKTEATRNGCRCECGQPICTGLGGMSHDWHYRAHVASVLADLMAERQAEAWDQGARCAGSYGHEDDWTHDMTPLTENPYRPDPKDTRDE